MSDYDRREGAATGVSEDNRIFLYLPTSTCPCRRRRHRCSIAPTLSTSMTPCGFSEDCPTFLFVNLTGFLKGTHTPFVNLTGFLRSAPKSYVDLTFCIMTYKAEVVWFK